MKSNVSGKPIMPMPDKKAKQSNKPDVVAQNKAINNQVRDIYKGVENKYGEDKAIIILYTMLKGKFVRNINDPSRRNIAVAELIDLTKEKISSEYERINKSMLSLGNKGDGDVGMGLIALKYIDSILPDNEGEEDKEKLGKLISVYQQEHNRRVFVSTVKSITDDYRFLAETPELYYARTGYKSTKKFPDTKSLLRFEQLRSMVCSAMEKDNIPEEQAIDMVLANDVQLKNRVDAAVKRDKISVEKAVAKIVPHNVQLLGKRDREVLINRQRVINPTKNIEEPEL